MKGKQGVGVKSKLHICCGDVYLLDYLNVDIKGEYATTPGLVNLNLTVLSNYYKHSFGTPRRDVVVDGKLDVVDNWAVLDGSVEEVVMISSIEHFTKTEAEFIVSEVRRVLKAGGRFVVDFPDLRESVRLYYERDPEFLMRLIYCNRKDKYSAHRWGYTENTFRQLLGDGWKRVRNQEIVKHAYPMISIVAIKG